MALASARPVVEATSRGQAETGARAAEHAPQLPALTGLRFVAAFAVVFSHFGWLGAVALLPLSPATRQVAEAGGTLAVGFFFVLSGFILALTYVSDGRLRGTRRAFYVARFARLYPAYLLGCALGIGAIMVWHAYPWANPRYAAIGARHPLGVLATTLTMTQTWVPYWDEVINPPAWSLGCEALFYAIFPLLVRPLTHLGQRALLPLAAACWLLSLAPSILVGLHGTRLDLDQTWVLHYNPILRLPEFLAGMCLGRWYALARPDWGVWLPLVLGLLIPAALLTPLMPANALYGGLYDPLFAIVIVGAAGSGWAVRGMSMPLPVLLGEASYALYILHFPLWVWVTHLLPPPPPYSPLMAPYVGIYVTATVALSVCVLGLIETPSRSAIRQALG